MLNAIRILMSRFISILPEISKCCHEIILEPTDILIVPPHWWHYVENLDETLTINSWIPMVGSQW